MPRRTNNKRTTPNKKRPARPTPQKTAAFNSVRTVDTITRSLAKSLLSQPRLPMTPYLHCRFNPFGSRGGTSIPDGSNNSYIVTDSRNFDAISLTAGSTSRDFVIQTMAALPFTAMIGSTTELNVNGKVIAATPQYSLSTNSTRYYPIGSVPSYRISANYPKPGIGYEDPYQSTTGRLVSIGYKLTYTGPVNTCAGSITVTPNSFGMSPGVIVTSTSAAPAAGLFSISTYRSDLNITPIQYPVGSRSLIVDGRITPNAVTRETAVFRPEQTIYILPKHTTRDFKNLPTVSSPYTLYYDSTGVAVGQTASSLLRGHEALDENGIVWFDNDWEGYTIYASGLNADASFRFDSIICMEYNPGNLSPFIDLSLKASPTNLAAITQANKIQGDLPSAIPATANGFLSGQWGNEMDEEHMTRRRTNKPWGAGAASRQR